MIYYMSSPVYHQAILEVLEQTAEMAVDNRVSEEVGLLELMRKDITKFGNIEKLIIDLNCVIDLEDEIIQALEMYRVMYNESRVILLATNYEAGDSLLTACFQMGIYDLIITDDFNEVKNELLDSLQRGKTFKDSIRFKEKKGTEEKLIIKSEVKQVVNKVMLAITGTDPRMGVTHLAIMMAGFLRSRGFRIALVERNESKDFSAIKESFDAIAFEYGFSIGSIDYYPACTDEVLNMVVGKAYNFIILDYGDVTETDFVEFNKCEKQFIVCGSKPWETQSLNRLFSMFPENVLKNYHYLFNFTEKKNRAALKKGMGVLEQVYFPSYVPDPFNSHDFVNAEEIFAQYLPVPEEKRNSYLQKIMKGRKRAL